MMSGKLSGIIKNTVKETRYVRTTRDQSPGKLLSRTVGQRHGGGNDMRISNMGPPCIDELHINFKKEIT